MTKIIDTETLRIINASSIAADRNRNLVPEFFDDVDSDGIHVVAFNMVHNDVEIRVQLYVKMKNTMNPTVVWLDMSMDEFDALPEAAIENLIDV